jgi:hypothetical protein
MLWFVDGVWGVCLWVAVSGCDRGSAVEAREEDGAVTSEDIEVAGDIVQDLLTNTGEDTGGARYSLGGWRRAGRGYGVGGWGHVID